MAPRRKRVQLYADEAGQWRWRVKAANNRITSSSGESFDSKENARRAAESAHPDVPIEDQPTP
jgi:uncharacterized protein YegP (UPF0339 family)